MEQLAALHLESGGDRIGRRDGSAIDHRLYKERFVGSRVCHLTGRVTEEASSGGHMPGSGTVRRADASRRRNEPQREAVISGILGLSGRKEKWRNADSQLVGGDEEG